MTPERWTRAKELFQAAVDRSPDEREDFLRATCPDDPGLVAKVLALLQSDARAGSFLDVPSAEGTESSTDDDTRLGPPAAVPQIEGRRIGPYLVQGRIGQGGMGVVYRAMRDDAVFNKTVALKLVHGGARPEHLVRLARERQMLARLQHPNIATILDGGTTEEGQPYLVMEYVDGARIDLYCDARGLGTGERLAIFQTVCAAVHYAHQNLIVHRDLKPANIMVTADGQPKLLDFGIAKWLAAGIDPEEAPTATLLPGMTPEYASPEQVRGQPVTTASDVYSLGVVLYELLTGSRPYVVRADSLEEIVRAVCGTEPRLPSAAVAAGSAAGTRTSSSELRGDLDTIVLKALRKEPSRRYLSALEMAEDVRRHREGLPVLARKDTVRYRVSKFVGRHRAGVAAAALVLVTLLGGLAMTARQARIAETNRRRAERRFEDVRRLANSFLFEFHDAIAKLPGSTKARELVVTRAVEYLDSLAQESAGDSELRRELAKAYQRLADLQGNPQVANLGDTAGALASYGKGLAMQEALSAAAPGDLELRRELARTLVGRGGVQAMVGDLPRARESYERAFSLYEGLAAATPDDRHARQALANTEHRIGRASYLEGDAVSALEKGRRALTRREALLAAYPGDRDLQAELAESYRLVGTVLSDQNDAAAGLELQRRAHALRESIAAADPTDLSARVQLSMSYLALGNSLFMVKDLPRALDSFRKAVAMTSALAAADPQDVQARRLHALALNTLGTTLRMTGHPAEAISEHERSLSIVSALLRSDSANATYQYDVANTYMLLGEDAEAEAKATRSAAGQPRHWQRALMSYQKSDALFRGMRAGGVSVALYKPDMDRVERGLADSRAALAKLNAR